jgi:hypothetical protein
MSSYVPRYPGIRWKIVYGRYTGIQKFAVALFAETVWNPHCPLEELSQRALSPYYQGQY